MAATSPTLTASAATEDTLSDLMLRVLRVPNPQETVDGRPGEGELLAFVCDWLRVRQIPFEADLSWGVHLAYSASEASDKPAVLLTAHLDSDTFDVSALKSLRLDPDANVLLHHGDVGLDCKSGVAIALFVLESLRLGRPVAHLTPLGWRVHVLFTVGEESGQKGAIRAPLPRLLAGQVRHAIVLDRKTGGSCAPRRKGEPIRHVVTQYKGVPLLDVGCGEELVSYLEASMRLLGLLDGEDRLPRIESPNCSDALELRGRWDAEVAGPELLQSGLKDQELDFALFEYSDITDKIRRHMDLIPPSSRVSWMDSAPRITRYSAMANVHNILNTRDKPLDPHLWLSCVNLSYDYDEYNGRIDLKEMEDTALIVLGFIAMYFSV